MTTPPVDTSTSPLLDAREALQTTIAAAGYDCYLYGSANLVTPCVVIEPNGWAPSMAGGVVAYTVNVTCLYNATVGPDSFDGCEEMARAVYLAARDAGWLPVEVPPPGVVAYNERQFVGVQFTVGTHVTL